MDIDSVPQSQRDSYVNFNYLCGLIEDESSNTPMDAISNPIETTSCISRVCDQVEGDRSLNLNERFVNVLDQLDARVEKFRKDALSLQEKRDFLLMSIDLIKSNEMIQNMKESEREEILSYVQRVNARLSTVELSVRTIRDIAQQDSLSQINELIDQMITMGDPALSRQKCQQYLNSCCSTSENYEIIFPSGYKEHGPAPVDKKFESVLLGCTLDDQKNIKKRLQALMGYLNKQTIRT